MGHKENKGIFRWKIRGSLNKQKVGDILKAVQKKKKKEQTNKQKKVILGDRFVGGGGRGGGGGGGDCLNTKLSETKRNFCCR